MEPIIISVAPNGARKTKQDNPNIPLSADEIAADAKECMEAGATLLHMHIRDEDLGHTLDIETYRNVSAKVRAAVGDGMIIQVTSEAVGIYKPEEQMQMVRDLRPESVSLAIREIIPEPLHEETAAEFLRWVFAKNILPQYILYNEEEVKYFAELRKRGIVPGEKVFVLFVLGKRTESVDALKSVSKPDDLDPYLECFGDEVIKLKDTIWAVSAFGENENACMVSAAECGGNPRIGFENNHVMVDGSQAISNAALVSQFRASISHLKRGVASVEEARGLLKL